MLIKHKFNYSSFVYSIWRFNANVCFFIGINVASSNCPSIPSLARRLSTWRQWRSVRFLVGTKSRNESNRAKGRSSLTGHRRRIRPTRSARRSATDIRWVVFKTMWPKFVQFGFGLTDFRQDLNKSNNNGNGNKQDSTLST